MAKMNYSRPCFQTQSFERFYYVEKPPRLIKIRKMRGKERDLWARKLNYLSASFFAFPWERRIIKSVHEQFVKTMSISARQKEVINKIGTRIAALHRAALSKGRVK